MAAAPFLLAQARPGVRSRRMYDEGHYRYDLEAGDMGNLDRSLAFGCPLRSVADLNLGIDRRIGVDEFPVAKRPIDHHRFPHKVLFRYKSPITRIIAKGTIIP